MIEKYIGIPQEHLDLIPSDFVRDATRIFTLMHPLGPRVEVRPFIIDGQYDQPEWTLFYYVGSELHHFTFLAPFRYIRDLMSADPSLASLFGVAFGASAPMPIADTRAFRYIAAQWKDKIAEEQALLPKEL